MSFSFSKQTVISIQLLSSLSVKDFRLNTTKVLEKVRERERERISYNLVLVSRYLVQIKSVHSIVRKVVAKEAQNEF